MRAVVQCVSEASVTVEGRAVGAIGKGYVILLGVGHGDTEDEAERLPPVFFCDVAIAFEILSQEIAVTPRGPG